MTNSIPVSLSAKLQYVGIRIMPLEPSSKHLNTWIDLEGTLIEALVEASRTQDHRLLSLVLTWASIHGDRLIIEKWEKLLKQRERHGFALSVYVQILVAYMVHFRNPAWKRLLERPRRPAYLLSVISSKALIRLNGKNRILASNNILVPEGAIRIRATDVFSIQALVLQNLQYKNRYLFGPSWRADIITALQMGCSSPTEISRTTGCSYEPAHRVLHEYVLAQATEPKAS